MPVTSAAEAESAPPCREKSPKSPTTKMPELPKADPKSQVKALVPDKTLYLETLPDKSRRVLLVAEVCLREGPLEVLLCKNGTKEHEAVVRTAVDARLIHAALIAAGAKPGSPVQFVNPKTNEEVTFIDFARSEGRFSKHFDKDGKPSETLLAAKQDRLENWRLLQELAGLR